VLMCLYSLASSWVSRLSDLGRVPLAQSIGSPTARSN
jgi:hypothetical protein